MKLLLLLFIFALNIILEIHGSNLRTTYSKTLQVKTPKVCFTKGCKATGSWILDHIDQEVDPCEDFFKFSCGKFLNKTKIPDDQLFINTFSDLEDILLSQLKSSIEEKNKPTDSESLKLVKTFYWSCMNDTRINELGLNPLHQIIGKLGGWPVLLGNNWNESDFNWMKSVYKFRKYGFSTGYFIDFSIGNDLRNNSRNILYLDQPELSFSIAKGFSSDVKYLRQIREVQAYHDFMVDIAEILGADRETASEELGESLNFELKLAGISLPKEAGYNVTSLYNIMTVRNLTKQFPSIPWLDYFNNILSITPNITDNEIVLVSAPSFVADLENLLKETPKRVQANYAVWRAIKSSISYLNSEIRKKEFEYNYARYENTERQPKWKECVNLVSRVFPFSASALYVRKYFKMDAKINAIQMVNNIKQSFKEILKSVEWIDKKTRRATLEKIDGMKMYIAYPDEILDDFKLEECYKNLKINSDYYFESLLNISIYATNYSYSKFRQPINNSDWVNHGSSAVINAFYSHYKNSIHFPAGILQGAFFNNDRPRYVNYGSIGYVIGHEIAHGFDDKGSQFDKHGNLIDWWQTTTKEKYLNLTQCIINQYGNYTVSEIGYKLNGVNTQSENIADNGGIKVAYLAYKKWARQRGPEPRLPGLEKYTPHQMFWISMANTMCDKYRPEALKIFVAENSHSPGEFRILGSMSNMHDFSNDFKCKSNSKMNPKNKCTVW